MYTAGYMVREGKGSKLFDLAEQARAEAATRNKRPGLMVIVHPPFEALFFAPLARLSYASAYLVWGVINILLWTWFAYLARSFAPVPRQTFQYMLLCFTFFPLWETLLRGQTTLVLLVLYTLTHISLRRQQDLRAGAFLGLGLSQFQLVLPFAFLFLLRRKWRVMAGFAVSAVLLCGLSIAVVGWSGVISYLNLLVHIVRNPIERDDNAILPADIAMVRGILGVLVAGRGSREWITIAAIVIGGLLILFTGILWRGMDRRQEDASQGLMFATALAVTLATVFPLHDYDLALLPLAVILAIGSPQCSRKTPWRTILYVSIAALYMPPIYLLLTAWNALYLLWLPLFVFALALFALVRQPPQPEFTANHSNGAAVANARSELEDSRISG
ncbi:MAG: DUF2029 domain-containing protein [Acidobacteriia bacterium]|nr:DUF2029 domain-containing protein [Terriglobia bacterium]